MPERTLRQEIILLLQQTPSTVKDLSKSLKISEKEIPLHLEHIRRSIGKGQRLVCEPAQCMRCGYVFEDRKRFTIPSRCPRCRHEGISPPVFSIG